MKFICKRKQLLSLLLTLTLVFTLMSHLALAASAETLETTVSSSLTHTTKAISTTTPVTTLSTSSVTTIYHVNGTASERCMGGTYYFTASEDLASPKFNDVFSAHGSQLGLWYQRQIRASNDIYCKISAEKATGTYGVHLYWSGVSWNQKVYTTYSGGNNVDQNRTIAYVPCNSSKVTGAVERP